MSEASMLNIQRAHSRIVAERRLILGTRNSGPATAAPISWDEVSI
jgi:hypothetical protein